MKIVKQTLAGAVAFLIALFPALTSAHQNSGDWGDNTSREEGNTVKIQLMEHYCPDSLSEQDLLSKNHMAQEAACPDAETYSLGERTVDRNGKLVVHSDNTPEDSYIADVEATDPAGNVIDVIAGLNGREITLIPDTHKSITLHLFNLNAGDDGDMHDHMMRWNDHHDQQWNDASSTSNHHSEDYMNHGDSWNSDDEDDWSDMWGSDHMNEGDHSYGDDAWTN